ncbi:MAG: ABC transporter permease [Desulfovibrionaceae bacterium]|jgi:putative ABC transport system permease protein|nr:ABC transporter permease [Desulfovibrionaceae bacterium]
MQIGANFKEAVTSLYGSKQRTILALLGIVIGIGSVIAMVSIGTIVQEEALRQFMDMGTDILSLRKEYQGGDSGFGMRTTSAELTLELVNDIPTYCSQVATVAPYTSEYGTMKHEGKKESIPALGITPTFPDLNKLHLKQGRYLTDLDKNEYFCVIGEKVEGLLRSYGVTELVGAQLYFKDKLFTVVGVIDKVNMGTMRPYETNEGILIPFSTLTRLTGKKTVQSAIARMTPSGDHMLATRQITNYVRMKNPKLSVRVRSAEEIIAQMQKQMQLFTLLLGAIGSISLIVGGVGVMNVMLVSVAERKKEIGIRRALGARQGDIQGQFIIESLTLCLVGGLLGIGLGVGASYIISRFSDWQFMVSYSAIVLGVGVSAGVGLFFGYYPARQASRLNPIDALRGS